MITIAVNGALGRMGSRILAIAQERPNDFKVVQTFDLEKLESLLPYAKGEKKLICDVLIDFSGPDGANGSATAAHFSKKAVVIGSTGLDEESLKKIGTIAKGIPVVLSSNMSVGVNLMLASVEQMAKKLSGDYAIQITEAHHCHKKDAPSGTALMLARGIAKAKGWDIQDLLKSWKEGKFDPSGLKDKIGMKVVREGEIVGDHTVFFSGPAETLEVTHRARSRDTFARGALLAAQFVSKQKSGLYTMKEVLTI